MAGATAWRYWMGVALISAGWAFAGLAAAQSRTFFTLSADTGVRYSTTSCDLDFTLRNDHPSAIEQIGIDVSVHDDRGNTADTLPLVFRYVEPGKEGEQKLMAGLPCDRLGVIKIRRVWDCKIGGTAYGDCLNYIRGMSYSGVKVER